MILLIEIAIVIILFIALLYGIKYALLISIKYNADKDFNILFNNLNKHYDIINTLFSNLPYISQECSELTENTKNLIFQAYNFSIQKDGNERIIAYANSILENTNKIIEATEGKETNIDIQKYNNELSKFNVIKENYNHSARNLRHYADVFPTSLFARLKKIKTMDYLL